MQGTLFKPRSRKIPRAVEQRFPCATTTEPVLYSLWAATTEACKPRICAPQEKLLQMRSLCKMKSSPCLLHSEKCLWSIKRFSTAKINNLKKHYKKVMPQLNRTSLQSSKHAKSWTLFFTLSKEMQFITFKVHISNYLSFLWLSRT